MQGSRLCNRSFATGKNTGAVKEVSKAAEVGESQGKTAGKTTVDGRGV